MSMEDQLEVLTQDQQFELEKRKILMYLGVKEAEVDRKFFTDFYRQIRVGVDTKYRIGL